tara:strand:- start:413 stop:1258 length:846 start_codon:yes stop_codon:yes gene_type:complete
LKLTDKFGGKMEKNYRTYLNLEDGPIRTKIIGKTLLVTIDRPKANAIDLKTSRLMGEVFREFRDSSILRVGILTAAGSKFFCPGWDLKAAAGGDAVDGDYGVGGFGGIQELPHMNKPMIAAINGICCGGGLEIALSCDIILAAEEATFALPEIKSGTVADAASIKLPKRIPHHIAMEMLITGRWIDASEANKWGLVNHILKKESLLKKALNMAQDIANGPPLVMSAIKEVVRESEDTKFQDILNKVTKRQLHTIDKLYGSEDLLEGQNAFVEKRDPIWKGK